MKRELRQGVEDGKEDHDSEELEVRMLQIDQGDRSDPKLVELDTIAAELEERERQGLLAEAHFDPDWRTELGVGEEIFVKNPDGMEHFCKKMRTRMLLKSERSENIRHLADKLLQERVIAVPLQVVRTQAFGQTLTRAHKLAKHLRTHTYRSGRREMRTQTGSQSPRKS
jgi:hypothetical protein